MLGMLGEQRFPKRQRCEMVAVGEAESPQELARPVLQRAVDEKGQKVRQYRRTLHGAVVIAGVAALSSSKTGLRTIAMAGGRRTAGREDRVRQGLVFEEDSSEPLYEVATIAARPG